MKEEEMGNVFPRYIDRPRLIAMVEIDEFFLFFGMIMLCLVLSFAFPNIDSLFVIIGSVVIGVAAAYALRKFKKNRPIGYTFQLLYRMGVISPTDDKKGLLKHSHLKKLGRVIPYGFTRTFYN